MAGAGYKLFNTGDVLTAAQVNTYLMEQTVMVFADAAARTTALSGVVSEGMISYLKDTNAVEVYDGSNWVSSDDPNAIQNSIINAKGDLIVGSANDTPSILSVSSDGSTLVADSSTTTGLRYTAGTVQANPVLNSAMQVWQRGTSFALVSGGVNYTADRWAGYRNATGATVSRQTTSDTTNLPFIQYCARVQRDSGNNSTALIDLVQMFETVNTIPFAGKTVTLSFYGRKGANYSSASDALTFRIQTGTGTDQNILSTGYTGSATAFTSTATLTTTWQRFSASGTISASATEMTTEFFFTPVGTAGANDYFEITGVQIDVGSVALPFRSYSATLAGELAAAQRYYVRFSNSAQNYVSVATGQGESATSAFFQLPLPVPMRVVPTSIDFTNLGVQESQFGGILAVSALAFEPAVNQNYAPTFTATCATGLTQYRNCRLMGNNNSSAYLAFSAEL